MEESASIPTAVAARLLTHKALALAQALRLLDHALSANPAPDTAAASREMPSLRRRAEQLETLAAISVTDETTADNLRDGVQDGIGLALDTVRRLGAEPSATRGRKSRAASARRLDAVDAMDTSALANMLCDELLKQRQTLEASQRGA
jgi:hypothetical protein